MALWQRKYFLEAQSPMIHFQPNQEGATLRATEVKPKLDRYLWQRLGEIPPEWRIPGQERALNYKLRFYALEPDTKNPAIPLGRGTPYDIYWANMGNRSPKMGIRRNAEMTVICLIPELAEIIDRYIGDFFIAHNFGTMQDKGFGSFVVEGKERTSARVSQVLRETYQAKCCYCFHIRSQEAAFSRIKRLYYIMKSGLSREKQASLLFSYMNKKRIGNEKDWLKQKGLVPTRGRGPQNPQDGRDPHYVRALLGVTKQLRFKGTVVNISNSKIDRLASPIFFKIIDNEVYYVGRRLEKEIYGAAFSFSGYGSKKGTLTVPSREQLGEGFIDDFLEYCFNALQSKFSIKKV